MQPQTRPDRVRWLEHAVAGLALELRSAEAQLRALTADPPLERAADRRLAALLQGQLQLMTRQCALVAEELGRLLEDSAPAALPDGAPPG
jgi:hypothetical protein